MNNSHLERLSRESLITNIRHILEFTFVVTLKKVFDALVILAPHYVVKKQYAYIFRIRQKTYCWLTHNAGLFACLSTQLFTVRNLQINSQLLPCSINNFLSMRDFKSVLFSNTLSKYFKSPSAEAISTLRNIHLDSRVDIISHHGNYHDVFYNELNPEWFQSYLDTYLAPSNLLRSRINYFANKYTPKQGSLVGVIYRGTDKATEIAQDPIESFFSIIDQILKENSDASVIIQTDQYQVQQSFCKRYSQRCTYIDELPTTTSNIVMHKIPKVVVNKDLWTLDLLAMAYYLSICKTLIVNTGNVGFFTSMLSLLNGNRIIQLR